MDQLLWSPQFCNGYDTAVWLSPGQTIDELLRISGSKPIEYSSHNVGTPRQAMTLMKLFGKWIEYADTLRGI